MKEKMQKEKKDKEIKGLTFKPDLRSSKSPQAVVRTPRMSTNLVT